MSNVNQLDNRKQFQVHLEELNRDLDVEKVEKVLIIYDEEKLYIGDSCVRFSAIGFLSSFFSNASMELIWPNKSYSAVYFALLKNSPYFININCIGWEQTDFFKYDVVIVISYREDELLELVYSQCKEPDVNKNIKTHFYSLSVVGISAIVQPFFPMSEALVTEALKYNRIPEIFISEEEKEEAGRWLDENGLEKDEKLFVLIDSASTTSKVMTDNVFTSIIKFLLSIPKSKILIFDEFGTGKSRKYGNLLEPQEHSKIIFAEKLGLRKDITILGSSQVRLILGPCTGVLHCASGIYNVMHRDGREQNELPLIVTYTGVYEKDNNNVRTWWESSPLVKCLILFQDKLGDRQITLLTDVDEDTLRNLDTMPGENYTADLIINFLEDYLREKV